MHKIKSIEMDNPNTFKYLGADLNPPLNKNNINKWFQPCIIATQFHEPSPYCFADRLNAQNEIH
jgi:hypothetical protein